MSTALVVDDSEPFRRFICSTLESRPNLKIISQASDGLEAVEKAQVLKPDLILLDIGLPSLNGIEAAHRISRLIPTAKILFVSQISDADVVQEALSNGAIGYVWKQDAGIALLPAVEAALRGAQFVSSGIHAAAASLSVSSRNSASGIANSAKPQFKQTRSFGNTQTKGFSHPSRPAK